jgi:hypothetical protein
MNNFTSRVRLGMSVRNSISSHGSIPWPLGGVRVVRGGSIPPLFFSNATADQAIESECGDSAC